MCILFCVGGYDVLVLFFPTHHNHYGYSFLLFFSIFYRYCTKTRRMNENNEINWKELTDCKYFLTGRCNLNKKCLFRHCFQAKNTNQICYKWDKYQCLNSNCPFRHPNSLSDIQIIPTIVETVGTTTKESNHSIKHI